MISQIPTLRTHIWQVRSGHIYPNPSQWFHRFLFWELIFGRSGLDISTPIPHSDFTDSYSENSYLAGQVWTYLPQSLTVISQIPNLRIHIWQARSWQIYLFPWVLILQIPIMRVHIWTTRSWWIHPSLSVSNDNFTDSYSESSYLADQVLGDLPHSSGNFTDSYSENSYLADQVLVDPPISVCLKWQFHRFLVWELMFGRPDLDGSTLSLTGISQIPTLRAHILQTRSWEIYPLKWQFHRSFIWGLIFGRPGLCRSSFLPPNNDFTDSYSENSYLVGQVLADLPLPLNSHFTDSYSESLYVADQVLGDIPPQLAMSQIPTRRAHIWQTRSWWIYPPQMSISRFLLSELIFGRPGLDISTPVPHSDFTDSYSERSCLADQVLGELPHSNGNFTDSYSENSFLTDQVLVDLSSQMAMSKIPTLRTHIWETRSWHIFHPPPNSDFTDSYSENSFLTDQVLVDPPLSVCLKWKFHRFLLWELIFGRLGLRRSTLSYGNFTDSYSEGSYLADQVLVDPPPPYLSQMKISQIPTLRTHIWETRSWHIFHSPTKQWFNRFLLWEFIFGRPGLGRSISQLSAHFTDSYSESSYLDNQVLVDPPFSPYLKWQFHRFLLWELIFVRPGLGRSPPLSVSQMTISQIPTLRAYVWQARSWWIYPRLTQGFHRFLL